MVGELLWVYEGLTQYLGYVLAERSGIWSESYYKERLAQIAAFLDNEPGRRVAAARRTRRRPRSCSTPRPGNGPRIGAAPTSMTKAG